MNKQTMNLVKLSGYYTVFDQETSQFIGHFTSRQDAVEFFEALTGE